MSAKSILALGLLLLGCSTDATSPRFPANPCGASPDPCTLTVQPSSATLRVGDTLTFRALLSQNVIDRRIRWTTSDSVKMMIDTLGRSLAKSPTASVSICVGLNGGLNSCSRVLVTP